MTVIQQNKGNFLKNLMRVYNFHIHLSVGQHGISLLRDFLKELPPVGTPGKQQQWDAGMA